MFFLCQWEDRQVSFSPQVLSYPCAAAILPPSGNGEARCAVDSQRFVQVNRVNMYQARKDKPHLRRQVKRVAPAITDAATDADAPPSSTVPAPSTAAASASTGAANPAAAAPAVASSAVAGASTWAAGLVFCFGGALSTTRDVLQGRVKAGHGGVTSTVVRLFRP